MRYTVVLTGELPALVTSLLSQHVDVIAHPTEDARSEEDLAMLLAEADAAIVLPSDPITRRVLESNPNLRMVAGFGGCENVDLEAARELGVTVTDTAGVLPEEMARIATTNVLLFLRGAFRESRPSP